MQTLLNRLEKLEKHNRRLNRAVVLMLVASGSLLLMGQARPSHQVEATAFVLKDTDGHRRAELAMSASRPTLTLRDANGFPLVSLAGSDEPFFALTPTGTEDQVQINCSKHLCGLGIYGKPSGPYNGIRAGQGIVNGLPPALDLYDDKTGKTRVDIDATRGVTLSDTNEEPRAILAVPADGPTLALTDRHGFVTKIGSAHLMTALTGENHKASAASIVMWGKDGEVIWSAPPDN